MNTKSKEIGDRIREARKKKRLSQSQLSELLDISPSHMSDIENGKTNIGLDIFMHLTEILQVSADWLLQTDIPPVNTLLNNEAYNIFADCTSSEAQILLRIIKEIKMVIQEAKKKKGPCLLIPQTQSFFDLKNILLLFTEAQYN